MDSFERYLRRVFVGTLSLILVVAGIFLFVQQEPWARGIVLGGIASLTNLVIMAGDVRRQGRVAEGQLVRPAYGRYALRMTINAAVLVYSALSVKVVLWAAIPALFASQLIMTCGELLGNKEQEIS